eukprot:CAMPEP_0174745242 /NCGR_PEP_ID=MMETSP1094-20130205/86345_1 /TAXON_ID=156173 /ORGANISM="Chrysochromulina brevifilum, Strain UTEX LB 985" /LENGTH=62 /DNA_ID=CAMNT_0015949773 /DNA_START=286 /DNA_END=470 /DNA_ORIENTATION=+
MNQSSKRGFCAESGKWPRSRISFCVLCMSACTTSICLSREEDSKVIIVFLRSAGSTPSSIPS